MFVFPGNGAGDALNVNQGAGVGVRKDMFPSEEAGEVVDPLPGQGDGGEVAQEGGGAVLFPLLCLVVAIVFHAFDPRDEPGEQGRGDAQGQPGLCGADAVARGAGFPLRRHEADFIQLLGLHDESETGKYTTRGLTHAFLRLGQGLGAEFQ